MNIPSGGPSYRMVKNVEAFISRYCMKGTRMDPITPFEYKKILQKTCPTLFSPTNAHKRVGIALSGGPDSMALLALTIAVLGHKRVMALTVVHDSQENGGEPSSLIQELVKPLKVDHLLISLNNSGVTSTEMNNPNKVNNSGMLNILKGSSVQERCREMRYAALRDTSLEHELAFLFSGHHLDDDLCTFFMRLSRYSSLEGLAGIRPLSMLPETPFCSEELFALFESDSSSSSMSYSQPVVSSKHSSSIHESFTDNTKDDQNATVKHKIDPHMSHSSVLPDSHMDIFSERHPFSASEQTNYSEQPQLARHLKNPTFPLSNTKNQNFINGQNSKVVFPLLLGRPLLGYPKERLVRTCQKLNLSFLEDLSNGYPDDSLRNMVRTGIQALLGYTDNSSSPKESQILQQQAPDLTQVDEVVQQDGILSSELNAEIIGKKISLLKEPYPIGSTSMEITSEMGKVSIDDLYSLLFFTKMLREESRLQMATVVKNCIFSTHGGLAWPFLCSKQFEHIKNSDVLPLFQSEDEMIKSNNSSKDKTHTSSYTAESVSGIEMVIGQGSTHSFPSNNDYTSPIYLEREKSGLLLESENTAAASEHQVLPCSPGVVLVLAIQPPMSGWWHNPYLLMRVLSVMAEGVSGRHLQSSLATLLGYSEALVTSAQLRTRLAKRFQGHSLSRFIFTSPALSNQLGNKTSQACDINPQSFTDTFQLRSTYAAPIASTDTLFTHSKPSLVNVDDVSSSPIDHSSLFKDRSLSPRSAFDFARRLPFIRPFSFGRCIVSPLGSHESILRKLPGTGPVLGMIAATRMSPFGPSLDPVASLKAPPSDQRMVDSLVMETDIAYLWDGRVLLYLAPHIVVLPNPDASVLSATPSQQSDFHSSAITDSINNKLKASRRFRKPVVILKESVIPNTQTGSLTNLLSRAGGIPGIRVSKRTFQEPSMLWILSQSLGPTPGSSKLSGLTPDIHATTKNEPSVFTNDISQSSTSGTSRLYISTPPGEPSRLDGNSNRAYVRIVPMTLPALRWLAGGAALRSEFATVKLMEEIRQIHSADVLPQHPLLVSMDGTWAIAPTLSIAVGKNPMEVRALPYGAMHVINRVFLPSLLHDVNSSSNASR